MLTRCAARAAPPWSLALPDLLAPLRRALAATAPWIRESVLLILALAVGFLLMPPLIWVVGNRALGPYIHGTNTHAGPGALMGDFFAGLGHGYLSYWAVALGPALILYLVRLFVGAVWRRPVAPQPPSQPVKDSRDARAGDTRGSPDVKGSRDRKDPHDSPQPRRREPHISDSPSERPPVPDRR
jgi:hypothetical protein